MSPAKAAPPESASRPGLAVFSSRDGFERWFHPAYAEAFAHRNLVHGDYLALHEEMLGRSVAGLLRVEGAAGLEFQGITDEMLRRMQETEGRVVTTFTGHYGHPGVPTSDHDLTYRRETLARLTRDGEAAYRACLASGAVCALAPRLRGGCELEPRHGHRDRRPRVAPAFPPVMHAEDFVWGAAVWQCCASGFAGHLPVAVRHDPGAEGHPPAPARGGQARRHVGIRAYPARPGARLDGASGRRGYCDNN